MMLLLAEKRGVWWGDGDLLEQCWFIKFLERSRKGGTSFCIKWGRGLTG